MTIPFSAGDIFIADFPGATGIKRRPVVVLSSAAYHSSRPDVIIGLITSKTASAVGPTDCRLQNWESAGLRLPSVFRAFLATVPRDAITARIGRLSESDWQAVRACVKVALVELLDPISR